jgi:hypothetical protein
MIYVKPTVMELIDSKQFGIVRIIVRHTVCSYKHATHLE